jgi:hypothetical protein
MRKPDTRRACRVLQAAVVVGLGCLWLVARSWQEFGSTHEVGWFESTLIAATAFPVVTARQRPVLSLSVAGVALALTGPSGYQVSIAVAMVPVIVLLASVALSDRAGLIGGVLVTGAWLITLVVNHGPTPAPSEYVGACLASLGPAALVVGARHFHHRRTSSPGASTQPA